MEGVIFRGTTPPITLRLPFSFDRIDILQLTFSQHGIVLELGKDDFTISETEENVGTCWLTQEQTLAFRKGVLDIQLRLLDMQGYALASLEDKVTVLNVLHDNILGGEPEEEPEEDPDED